MDIADAPTCSDRLIASCYESAAGRVSFNELMHEFARAFDCLVAQVIGVDVSQGRLIFSFEGGSGAPEGVIDYATTFHKIDPHAQHMAPKPVGTLVAYSREFSAEFIERCDFYQSYLIPYGVRHTHAAKLYQDDQIAMYLGLHRATGKQPIDGEEWKTLERLCFHLTRAAGLYLTARKTFADSAIGRVTLDRLKTPLFLVDEARHLVLHNRAGEAALAGDGPFYASVDRRLCCPYAEADTQLTLAIRALNLSGRPGLQHQPKRDRVVVRARIKGKQRPILVSAMALRPEATMGAFGSSALAMIVVFDSNQLATIDPFALAATFDLSPAEAKVAVALAGGASAKEIARQFAVSANTVRTQIQSVHMKFGVNRTSEFIALIHSASFGLFE